MLKGETGGRVKIGSLSAASAAAGQPASQPLSLLAQPHGRCCAILPRNWRGPQRNAVNNGAAPAEILAVLVRKGDQEKIWAGLKALRGTGVDRMSVRKRRSSSSLRGTMQGGMVKKQKKEKKR